MIIELKTQKPSFIIIDAFQEALNQLSVSLGDDVYIITDSNVYDLYIQNAEFFSKYKIITIPAGESSKSLATYEYIIQEIINNNTLHKNAVIIGFGGGVVGDIAGFVASTLYRGLKFVQIPTTLLSLVDSSIGGKNGLNIANRKNIIGNIKQADYVIIDVNFIKTLSQDDYYSGLGEIIKHALIYPSKLLELLENKAPLSELVYESLLVKKHFVEADEFDTNTRMILNFGHTFGHLIELDRNLKHGIAVVIGMLAEINYAIDFGITKPRVKQTLLKLIEIYDLKIPEIDYKDYLPLIFNDKKNIDGAVHFIYLEDIGCPKIVKVRRSECGYITST